MRVALFRATVDAQRTARRLAELGHEAVLAPVIHIVPTGRALPAELPDAVIFTSTHAVQAIAHDPNLPALLSLPCFCVGDRTAAKLRDLGFRNVQAQQADAAGLATACLAALPTASHALFVTGRDRKPVLESRLGAAGHRVTSLEVYRAEALRGWDATMVKALGTAQAALHYSRRSAELTLAAAVQSGSGAVLRRLVHHCLSADTAEPLRLAGVSRIVLAPCPDEDALLATLDR